MHEVAYLSRAGDRSELCGEISQPAGKLIREAGKLHTK
jgi:hypothetical protein